MIPFLGMRPKAFYIVDSAIRDLDSTSQQVWAAYANAPERGMTRQVLTVALEAVERASASLEERFSRIAPSEDPETDYGNDLAYLHTVANAIKTDLARLDPTND